MGHTPYGYRIENGKAVIDDKAADKLRTLFQAYLSGDSLDNAAKKAGIQSFHAGIGKMLHNTRYLGDEYYPKIIDTDTYSAVQFERVKRAEKLGRIRNPKEKAAVPSPTEFRVNEGTLQFDDPFQQAEYAYSLIESEMQKNECE